MSFSELSPVFRQFRAAIVHDPKWTHHAALLAALLRVRHAVIRSFLPADFDDAIIFLPRGAPMSPDNVLCRASGFMKTARISRPAS